MKNLSECTVCFSNINKFSYLGHTNRNPNDGERWTVFKCQECSHGYMNPQPEWSDLEPYYSSNYEAYDPDHSSEFQQDLLTIEKANKEGEFRHLPIPKNKNLLDVGCGGGYFIRIAQKLGAKVQGVEPSEAGFKLTSSQGLPVFHGMLDNYVVSSEKKR